MLDLLGRIGAEARSLAILARLPRPPHPRRRLGALVALACLALTGCGSAGSASRHVLPGPESLFQAPALLDSDPARAMTELKALGVERVREFVPWSSVAPATRSAGFDAGNPSAYPAANWDRYDAVVRNASARGIGVDLTVTGPAPVWAAGPGEPAGGPAGVWHPSASDFGAFMHAVAERYSGTYTPAGSAAALPRVSFWAIWNEPNYGIDLAPQAIDHSSVEVSPMLYRGLLDSAWSALQQTGHGRDTIVIGELAPRGITTGDNPGNFSGMVPLRFLRALYCVGGNLRPLTGSAAAIRGCPTSQAGSGAFRRQHPALFEATGFSDHPYPQGLAPNVGTPIEPDYADLPAIPKLEQLLDTLQHTYGSSTRFDIYDTEFGFQTNPPEKLLRAISPTRAAYYMNWAEYIHYRDPRIRTFDQYLLSDPASGSFATGLEFANGTPKATYFAFRMPLYLPLTAVQSGQPVEVWGCVRPAPDAQRQTGRPQVVALQFQPGGRGPFRTVRTVKLTNPHGYFDVTQSFSQGGRLRTSWTEPGGQTIRSRTVAVTIR
jgi:hypothetical protein